MEVLFSTVHVIQGKTKEEERGDRVHTSDSLMRFNSPSPSSTDSRKLALLPRLINPICDESSDNINNRGLEPFF
jgi:hypothetical protein